MATSRQLLGVHTCTIDPEGRIQLPSALRDELNPRATDFRLMVNLEPDGSLCLREKDDWDLWITALHKGPHATQSERRTLLFLSAHASSVRCDKTGRIRVPDALLASIGVDRNEPNRREVVLVGGFNEIRVWSPIAWAGFGASAREDFGAGLDALLGGGVPERAAEGFLRGSRPPESAEGG